MSPSTTQRIRGFVLAGLAVALLLALVVSGFASSSPDGLERVAEDTGFAATAEDHQFGGSPVADYTVQGVENERVSTGLAGVVGVIITFAVGMGVVLLASRGRRQQRDDPADPSTSDETPSTSDETPSPDAAGSPQ